MGLLEDYDQAFPGFLDFYGEMLGYYFGASPVENSPVRARMEKAFQELGDEASRRALKEFQEAGIFDAEGLSGDRQVALFWTSPLMRVYRAAIGYAPDPRLDLRGHFPPPVSGATELLERRSKMAQRAQAGEMAGGSYQYWEASLLASAPELYLIPFLPKRSSLVGLDLGCGWGRASLALAQQLETARFRCLDLGREELDILEALAARAGCGDRLEAVEGDVCKMPFAPDEFDFAVSFVLLDLLSDVALEQCLKEVLRCLKAPAPFYVEVPTQGCCRQMMLQGFTDESFVERLHGVRDHGKRLQLAHHDPRYPGSFTFAVLKAQALKDEEPPHIRVSKAKRLLRGADFRGRRLRGRSLRKP